MFSWRFPPHGAPRQRAAALAALGAMALALAPAPTTARQVAVAPGAADSVDALGAALTAAQPGDTLSLAPGIYRGSHVVPHGVSIVSRAGPDSTILDAAGERWVLLGFDLDRSTILAGLTLRNGRRSHPNAGGGGLHLRGSNPVVCGNVFEDHLGYLGAGLYAYQGSRPVVAHNTFRRCHGHLGGAVAAYLDCDLLLWDNVFEDNEAVSGGAVLCMSSAVVMANNTLVRNHAGAGGGSAIYGEASPALVQDNVIAFNRDSPAVYCLDDQGPPTFRRNLLWKNDAVEGGHCPAFQGTDGNCSGDPGFADAAGAKLRDLSRKGYCAKAAGAHPLASSAASALASVPDSLLATWREWVAAHARDPGAAQELGRGAAAGAPETPVESARNHSSNSRNSTR